VVPCERGGVSKGSSLGRLRRCSPNKRGAAFSKRQPRRGEFPLPVVGRTARFPGEVAFAPPIMIRRLMGPTAGGQDIAAPRFPCWARQRSSDA
jgi:hypothetical protein